MALGSTQPLTEMSTGSISWGKGGRCLRLKTYHHPVPLSRNLGSLTSWKPLGHSGPVMGLLCFFFYYMTLGRASPAYYHRHNPKTLYITSNSAVRDALSYPSRRSSALLFTRNEQTKINTVTKRQKNCNLSDSFHC